MSSAVNMDEVPASLSAEEQAQDLAAHKEYAAEEYRSTEYKAIRYMIGEVNDPYFLEVLARGTFLETEEERRARLGGALMFFAAEELKERTASLKDLLR